jgi:hypothetical protein
VGGGATGVPPRPWVAEDGGRGRRGGVADMKVEDKQKRWWRRQRQELRARA